MLRSIVPERVRNMGKIFHEYGGTIITVIAVVLLISFVTTSMNTGGVLYNAFGSMINSLSEKSNDMVNGAAGGSGNSGGAEEAGWPVSWNTMDVMDNPKVDMGDGTYLVKVSDYTPTAAELADTKMTVTMDGESASVTCLGVESMGDGCDIAVYDEDGMYLLLSVTTTEEIDGLQFPETGLWTIDYGSLGMDADVVVDVVPVLTKITELADGIVLFDSSSSTVYANNEATLRRYGLDPSTLTVSTAGLPNDYRADSGDTLFYRDFGYRYQDNYWSLIAVFDTAKSTYAPIVESIFDINVTRIGGGDTGISFTGCTNLISVGPVGSGSGLEIPNSITHIDKYAFTNCTGLTSVVLPNSVNNIGAFAFWNCTSLASIAIPDNVTSIGISAFSDCASLSSITIPDSVTSIGDTAFADCTSLTNVVIGDGVTSIGSTAFMKCSSLLAITIPNSVTNIGWCAFENCTSLSSVVFENTNGWWYAGSADATSGTELTASDLADATTAATYLKSTYYNKHWFRSEG